MSRKLVGKKAVSDEREKPCPLEWADVPFLRGIALGCLMRDPKQLRLVAQYLDGLATRIAGELDRQGIITLGSDWEPFKDPMLQLFDRIEGPEPR